MIVFVSKVFLMKYKTVIFKPVIVVVSVVCLGFFLTLPVRNFSPPMPPVAAS